MRHISLHSDILAADLLKTSLKTKKKLNDAYWLHQRELHVYNERVKEKGRLRQAGQLKLGCGKKELPRYVSPFATGNQCYFLDYIIHIYQIILHFSLPDFVFKCAYHRSCEGYRGKSND